MDTGDHGAWTLDCGVPACMDHASGVPPGLQAGLDVESGNGTIMIDSSLSRWAFNVASCARPQALDLTGRTGGPSVAGKWVGRQAAGDGVPQTT